MFVSSDTYDGDLASHGMTALEYVDAECNAMAQAAGLQGTFVGLLSDGGNSAISRLDGARGWYRTDGLAYADTRGLLGLGTFFYPALLDEYGDPISGDIGIWTGQLGSNHDQDGDCADWTDATNASSARVADPKLTSRIFSASSLRGCGAENRLYCFSIDNEVEVAPPPPAAPTRRIFMAQTAVSPAGLAAFDQQCQDEHDAAFPADTTSTFKALVAVAGSSALSRFSTTEASISRHDGVIVAPDLASFAAASLDAHVNYRLDNNDSSNRIWLGADSPGAVATAGEDCMGWASSSDSLVGWAGLSYSLDETFDWQLRACDSANYVTLCLEDI